MLVVNMLLILHASKKRHNEIMNIASLSPVAISKPAAAASKPAPAETASEQAKSACCSDLVSIGEEAPSLEKEGVIRAMIRQAPDAETVCSVVEALSAYPLEALQRVHDYGTKLEIYDFAGGDCVPDYLPTLAQANSLGAYNTKANILGVDKSDLAPFVLLHEFAHALDASLGNVSELPEWKGAHKLAQFTNQVVRPYAKLDSSEYLAENTAAFLISDEALYPMIENGFAKGLGVNDLDERGYWQENQNFCKGRLERIDAEGYRLVGELFETLADQPAPVASPAMTGEQWAEFIASRPGVHEEHGHAH